MASAEGRLEEERASHAATRRAAQQREQQLEVGPWSSSLLRACEALQGCFAASPVVMFRTRSNRVGKVSWMSSSVSVLALNNGQLKASLAQAGAYHVQQSGEQST